MSHVPGYLSWIQYCPDLDRMESINIGVLLFCPVHQFLDAKVVQNNQRVAHVFGSVGMDWVQYDILKNGIPFRIRSEADRIRTLGDLKHFIATQGNAFQFTPPRVMRVSEPEKELAEIFEEAFGAAERLPKVAVESRSDRKRGRTGRVRSLGRETSKRGAKFSRGRANARHQKVFAEIRKRRSVPRETEVANASAPGSDE